MPGKISSDNPLIPQFAYLESACSGKIATGRSSVKTSWHWIAKYPETDMADDAQNLIDYMDKEHPEIKEAQES